MNDPASSEAYAQSRRLLGANRHFAGPAAVLDALPPAGFDDGALARWQDGVTKLCRGLGWPPPALARHRHAGGTTLALAAPLDQLDTACDVNELAWLAAMAGGLPDLDRLLPQLRQDSAGERDEPLRLLLAAAAARGLPACPDDDQLSIGVGAGSQTWPRRSLPAAAEVDWDRLSAAPVLLVTGTNGKTTTVRLCAAAAAAAGHTVGYSCTDGVVIDGRTENSGDYAGPDGARQVLRHPAVDFAVLEVARGGMLRRGLAVDRARAAIVTNVSADHFGEFGIDSVTDLADAKLTVARVLGEGGLLVLNGDDSLLLQRGRRIVAEMPPPQPALGLFAADFRHQELAAHRAAGGASCGASDGRLWLSQGFAAAVDLGAVALMPLSLGGSATYNISNIAAAALASAACGIPPAVIALVLAGFGATNQDNPGRLERWTIGQAEILLDYAHNPDGLTALLRVAAGLRRGGRLGLVMGQAGNRSDAEIRQLAKAVVAFAPDLVLLKDEPGMLRGRAAGAVPALLRETLLADGLEPTRVHVLLDEVDAAASLLAWSRPGDVAVLSVHGKDSRPRLRGMLDLLQSLA